MIKKPELTPSLSFGNIVTLLTLVVGLGVGWGKLQGQVTRLQDQNVLTAKEVQEVSREFRKTQNTLEERIRRQEELNARMDERFTLILSMISEVKSQVTSLTEAQLGN